MRFTTKSLCRAGVIAALYAALTYVFMPFAFGPLQIRPAEALCLLPLFFPEAIPALTVGCMLSNLSSPYLFYDVIFGSLTTLLSALCTFLIGKWIKKEGAKLAIGGLFPVLLNAFILPLVFVFLCGGGEGKSLFIVYLTFAGGILLSEALWVYALGIPLYYSVRKLRKTTRFLGE